MQEARRRIARNRRALERDALRLARFAEAKLNWRLQSQERPLTMLLGAVGIGMLVSRLLSSLGQRQGWEPSLFRAAVGKIGPSFWKQVIEAVAGAFGRDEEDRDEEDAGEDAGEDGAPASDEPPADEEKTE